MYDGCLCASAALLVCICAKVPPASASLHLLGSSRCRLCFPTLLLPIAAASSLLQHAYMRPLGVISMLISMDEERGPCLFKVRGVGGNRALSCSVRCCSAFTEIPAVQGPHNLIPSNTGMSGMRCSTVKMR